MATQAFDDFDDEEEPPSLVQQVGGGDDWMRAAPLPSVQGLSALAIGREVAMEDRNGTVVHPLPLDDPELGHEGQPPAKVSRKQAEVHMLSGGVLALHVISPTTITFVNEHKFMCWRPSMAAAVAQSIAMGMA